jgi:NAD(P)-dependent dehydrogenase (short-subunit alcohol dehydrogenase family)
MSLEGKNIVITGATGGFGLFLSKIFLQNSANLFLIGRDQIRLNEIKAILETEKTKEQEVVVFCNDFENGIKDELKRALSALGKIDVLINNAAVHGPIGVTWKNDLDTWEKAFRVNFYSALELCQMIAPLMIANKSGSIINISGGGATGSRPNFSSYAIAKTALVRFTEILADEIAEFGIRVNAISPGAMATNLLKEVLNIDVTLVGQKEVNAANQTFSQGDNMEKAAKLCLYLASDESSKITGRLISAVWDDWENFESASIANDDYKLRRKIP